MLETTERIEWSRLTELPGVEVLLVERCMRRWRVFHETYTVCALLDLSGSEAEWTYRGKLHSSRAGELMLMEPGEVHATMTHTIPPCDFRVLLIAPSLAERAATELGIAPARPHLKLAHGTDPTLFQAFVRLHATLEGVSSLLERESCLANCIRLLFRYGSECGSPVMKQPARSVLLRARDLIGEHFSRSISLDELVAATGLSRFHLVRAFAKEFGVAPHAYQIRVRIARARTLLAAGAPPAQVAAETGFADQSHLARHFRAIYGVTPGDYRRRSHLNRSGRAMA